jgi:RNA polymerase sigma factor (sigma-70 family)
MTEACTCSDALSGSAAVHLSSEAGRRREALLPTQTTDEGAGTAATDNVADLLLQVRDGDPTAWDEVLRRYGKLVSTTVRWFRLQDADALDAVQMTWLRLFENVHRVQFPERLGGWLVTTARRECLRILRQAEHTRDLIDVAPETVADPSRGPEQRVIDADTARTLWCLVDELSPRRRTLVRALFTDNSRSYTEIARAVGISPGAIGPTRARALKQLLGGLENHGLGPHARL